MAERRVDTLSLVVGLLALVGAGLVLLDRTGAVEVDAAVSGAALLVAVAVAGLLRSLLSLRSGRLIDR